MENVELVIKKIISDRVKGLSIDEINNSTTLTDLGADSLDAVEIVMGIESYYKISISEEDFENLQTVDSIIKFLEQKAR